MPDREPGTYRSFVARQPIFDLQLGVQAYELLFRSSPINAFDGSDADRASSKVIASGSLLLDLPQLTGDKLAFVNVSREVLLQGFIRLLPSHATVVELLESVRPEPEVLAACVQLRDAGYRIALDDFVYDERQGPLLDLADVVKVDFLQTSPEERRALPRRLAGRSLQLLAEKVETHELLEEARGLGYVLFQGFFFSRPVVVSAQDVAPQKIHLLRILEELYRLRFDYSTLERVIKDDVALCYKLLRYINAAHLGLRAPVESIGLALALLGEREIRRWASIVVLSMIGEDRPQELLRLALVRARFCESLATPFELGRRADDLFLMGMFSVIDALLGRPMIEALAPLPLAEDVKAALACQPSPMRRVLDFSLAYERGEWDRLGTPADSDELLIAEQYVAALDWAARIGRGVALGAA